MLGAVSTKSILLKVNWNSSILLSNRTLFLTTNILTKCPPKHRVSRERRWRNKNNIQHYYPLVKSWHNLIPCDSCGNYHRKWMLCQTCYDQSRYETEIVRKVLRENGEKLSEEAVLKYKNDIGENVDEASPVQRIISINNRNRPAGWFSESLWKKM